MSSLSPGALVIVGLAGLSGLVMWLMPEREWSGQKFWIFSANHAGAYAQVVENWNESHDPDEQIQLTVLTTTALERRLLSGFLAGTPVPDLCEAEVAMAAKFFAGPPEAIGLVDLTERLQSGGLLSRINPPSFAPWTTRGRIFGLPHDVHPVLLAYRADLVEAAGIDVTKIETWGDFARVMRPLMTDENGDGYPDRYLLNFWETDTGALEILILQAGGEVFDAELRPQLNSETNAEVLASVTGWIAGPDRLAVNALEMNAEGNQMFLEGYVLSSMLPDWLAGAWQKDMPGLAGKMKLMPLPAWTPGGRRTSVRGGTMLCFPKGGSNFATDWDFALKLYFDPQLAEKLFQESSIISPVKDNWSAPYYDVPNVFFSGQAIGRAYIDAAPDVPLRTSSPYKPQALTRMTDALIRLKRRAEQAGVYDRESLLPMAREELAEAQTYIEKKMASNRFAEELP